ncbi:MAG: glycosyltransferase family 9 protein [Candidatus Hydrogenedentes bacterium]|nr:glycosyltransferase family 9 protein [Candidatus Hydrogenedentota bacterium]
MDSTVAQDANSFLVVRLGAIGDALRVCPAVRRLRRERPEATIAWAVEQWVYPIIASNPDVDRFHVLDRGKLRRGRRSATQEFLRFIREIRTHRYEVALDFHGRFKSGAVSRASGAKYRLGYPRGQSSEMNHLFSNVHVTLEDALENRVLRYLHLLAPLGIDPAFDTEDIGVEVAKVDRDLAAQWYDEAGRPELAVFPGCSENQSGYHRWPREKWIELLNRLGVQGTRSVLFWGPDELEFSEAIAAGTGDSVSLAPGTGLIEMMAMVGRFRAFAGSNTAAMHMAWLQGVPTAVFTGPCIPRTDAPLPHVPSRVLRADGFVRKGVSKRHLGDVVAKVSVDEAFEAVVSLLEESCGWKI